MPEATVTIRYTLTEEQASELQNQIDTYGEDHAADWLGGVTIPDWSAVTVDED